MKGLLFLMTFFVVGTAFGQLHSKRCDEINDSLDGAGAEGRTKWALKCYPTLRSFTDPETKKFMLIKDGVKYAAYPIFAKLASPEDTYGTAVPAPTNPDEPCWDPTIYVPIGFCQAGCFTPDQEVLMAKPLRYVAIGEASRNLLPEVVTLQGVMDGGYLGFKSTKVAMYTEDPEPKQQTILIFRTADNEVRVTPNHPLVDGRGYMVQARSLRVGDSLKTLQNKNEKIVEIEELDYFGKVYNIGIASHDPFENIIVANDFLSGTVYFQNDGLTELNRNVLRELLPEALLK